mgnify:CR=1 FL=1
MQVLKVRRIRAAGLYKIVALGCAGACVPLGVLFAVLGAADLMTLTWNGQPASGARALVVGPLVALLFSLFGAGFFGSLVAFGLWLYARFRPLELEFEPLADTGSRAAGS